MSISRKIPWPKLPTDFKVPLRKEYAMNDMWYLDTKEAKPIFEKQADARGFKFRTTWRHYQETLGGKFRSPSTSKKVPRPPKNPRPGHLENLGPTTISRHEMVPPGFLKQKCRMTPYQYVKIEPYTHHPPP